MLTTNMVVDNRYKILDEIGRGGMSIVYRATVERSGKIWAVKEVRKDGRNDYNVVKQNLIAEIETLKEVKHAKLPEIADVIDNDDSFIIVMDYIEGVSLDKIFSKRGAQPEEKVVDWAKQLCEVLGYLHLKNIIYRDMKPSNVMLKKNGEITIIDFGTAKKYEFDSGETTGLGTAGFAAPEQYGGHGRTDARTDIFCLGMTMYALLTGIDPQKDFIPETSIRKVNPEFPPGLDQIIQKCTRKNPDERYQSCEELLYYLERYKEIDKSSRKKKVMKVSLFISSLAVSLISGVCGGLLHLQAQAMATDNYKELIDEANAITLTYSDDEDSEKNEEYAQKIALYEQAIEVSGKAGDKDAYLGIFKAYLENDGYDAVFDEKEIEHMKKLMLNYKADLQANPEDYADVCYEIGELYWWYYYDDKNEIARQQEAVKWFQRVIENAGEDYDVKKLELATAYSEIGSTLQELTALSIKGNVDDDTYKQLFDNIKNMVDEIGSSTDTRDIVHLEMLEMARVVLRQYVYDFKRVFMKDREDLPEKPGREKIVGLYKEIDRQLHTIDIDSYTEDTAVKKKYTEIEENMKETKEKIEEIYSIQIKGTEIS